MRGWLALAAVVLALAAKADAACRDDSFDGASFTLCDVDAGQDLRLFHSGPDGPYGNFNAVNDALQSQGARLGFAMNAGMYHSDRSPVGLYVEGGKKTSSLVTREGPGNFGLLPNGVFCWGNGSYRVIESRSFKAKGTDCPYATQSGPMLVIDGALHPRFLRDSDSLNIRNGVGVSADGQRAVFAISNQPVNFHHFARLFRDHLGLPDALYFDGSISRLYAPELGRHDGGFAMGPIVGSVVPGG